jgi:hypothetical protein
LARKRETVVAVEAFMAAGWGFGISEQFWVGDGKLEAVKDEFRVGM